uniref:V-type proton ATPase subunit G n=1 Tax=Timema tahoe TaxID=61484 RepID=A0A7R9IM46_9NEOP|nr:unnamed protein product [Timema tahoe]
MRPPKQGLLLEKRKAIYGGSNDLAQFLGGCDTFPFRSPTRKARRLKQAKEEAQDEIEKYRQEREKQFKEFEAKHMGSREDVAARIEADTKVKIDEMNKQVTVHKEQVIQKILELVYDIKPELHQNYAASISK